MKNRIMALFTLFLLTIILISCSPTNEAPPENAADVYKTSESHTVPINENEQEMFCIVEAGKRLISELQSGIEPSNKAEWQRGNAVDVFKRYLKLDTLYVSGLFMNPNTPGSYICMISGYNGYNYGRSIDVSFSKSEPMIWSCSTVHYCERSDEIIEEYLSFLQNSDANGIAGLIAVDSREPSAEIVESAEKTINYYQSFCDLSEYTIRQNEYDLIYDILITGFRYTVEDAKRITFQVETRFGEAGYCWPVLYWGF